MRKISYAERVRAMNLEQRMNVGARIAQRAMRGGNVDMLYRLTREALPGESYAVMDHMRNNGGHQMLYLKLWLFHNCLEDFSINGLRAFIDNMSDADDFDDIIEFLQYDQDLIKCEDCGGWELNDMARTPYNCDEQVCRECIDDNYVYSHYYNQYVYGDSVREGYDMDGRSVTFHEDDEDFQYDDDNEEYYHVDYSPGSRVIGNYHSSKNSQRPIPSPWSRLKRRYMGVELEVECRGNSRAEKALALHKVINDEQFGKNVFFENDGSLNDGFEIISQPLGMDRHREVWAWLNDKEAVKGLRSHNTSTCGLHVHISREGMSKLQIAKIVAFINDTENEALVRAVARRYAEGYCKIKNKKIGNSAWSEDRYEAVNITPRKTIEFRIFKGSLKYESVLSAIQFANAVVDFCGRANTSIRDLKTDKFLEFIRSDESGDTDILVPYLNNRLESA